jgi:hypothetical protein
MTKNTFEERIESTLRNEIWDGEDIRYRVKLKHLNGFLLEANPCCAGESATE